MLKINELLDKAGKTVSSLAVISLGLAIIAGCTVAIKENVGSLFGKKIKAVVCIKKHEVHEENKDEPKPSKKSSSKKSVSKTMPVNEPTDEPKLETVE